MKNTTFGFTLEERGIHITDGNEDFILGYEEKLDINYAAAEEFAKEQGGSLPTVSQLRIVARHRDEINKALKEAGRTPISDDWFWTNELCWWRGDAYYLVDMAYGGVLNRNKNYDYSARAVSAL